MGQFRHITRLEEKSASLNLAPFIKISFKPRKFMSSWATLSIDGMTIDETQNYFHDWYFKKSERIIETVSAAAYYEDPEWDSEEPIKIYRYRMSTSTLKRRLSLAGYNRESLEREFKQQLKQQIDDAEAMIEISSNGEAARFLPILKSSTLNDWIERLKLIYEKKLQPSHYGSPKVEYDDELLTFMFRHEVFFSDHPTIGGFNFPCLTIEGYAVALLEFLPDTSSCILDVTDLIQSGWSEAFEDLEEFQQDFTNFHGVFKTSIEETQTLMKLGNENRVLARILYANVITAMETYLADTLKKQVLNRTSIERRFVRNCEAFKEKKISVATIFDKIDSLKDEIVAEIDRMSFHNLEKIPGLYKAVLDTEFPRQKMADLQKAVHNRHDIIHRNGKNTAGNSVDLSMTDVNQLIQLVTDVIEYIDKQIKDGLLDDALIEQSE